MADKLVVGDKNCTFNMVTKAMNKAPSVEDIVDKWKKIASDLGVEKDATNVIERNVLYRNWSAIDIIDETLRKWRSSASTKATLNVLIDTLNDHNLEDISNEILKAFKLSDDKESSQSNAQLQPGFLPQMPIQMAPLMQGQVPPMPAQYVPQVQYQHIQQGAVGYTYPGTLIPNIPPGNIAYVEGQPSIKMENLVESAVYSGTLVQNSNVDGISGSKPKDSPTNSCTFNKEDMKTRMLQVPQNTNVLLNLGTQPERKDDMYKLPGIKAGNGYALILNIIRYKNLGYRKGAQYDSFMLTQLFTQLGYKVIKYDDSNTFYTKDDMESIVKMFRDYVKKKNPASVVIFIGCHGGLEEIQLSDESFICLFESVVYHFDAKNCSKLNNVPKIFIIESCRDFRSGGPTFHHMSNTIICYARSYYTVSNKAMRDEDSGTCYIKSLVKVFAEKAYLLSLKELLDLTEGELWNSLIKYGKKLDNRHKCMHLTFGPFGTFYFKF